MLDNGSGGQVVGWRLGYWLGDRGRSETRVVVVGIRQQLDELQFDLGCREKVNRSKEE